MVGRSGLGGSGRTVGPPRAPHHDTTLRFQAATPAESKQPIVLLYAFDAEGSALRQELRVTDSVVVLGRPVLRGRLCNQYVVLAESGVGMTNAAMTAQRLIDYFSPAMVLFSGIAGAIDTSVHIGDIVICSTWTTHDYGYRGKDGFRRTSVTAFLPCRDSVTALASFPVDTALLRSARTLAADPPALDSVGGCSPRVLVGGHGASGNTFIDSREYREFLSEELDAMIVDMESAAVAQVCAVNGLPFLAFRSASDLAGGSGSETAGAEIERFFRIAADNSSALILAFIGRL